MQNDYLSQLLKGIPTGNNKKRAFISFDYEYDEALKNLLNGQAKLEDSPFYFEDWSVKEPFPQASWKDEVRTKIKQSNFMIVIIGVNTYQASGVLEEIKIANEEQVPCFGVHKQDRQYYVPQGLGKRYVPWTWEAIKQAINNLNNYRLLPPIWTR
jgi:hypothetical protein